MPDRRLAAFCIPARLGRIAGSTICFVRLCWSYNESTDDKGANNANGQSKILDNAAFVLSKSKAENIHTAKVKSLYATSLSLTDLLLCFSDGANMPLDGLFSSFNNTTLPWTNLGLEPLANQDTVKAKRREVLLKHPDKNFGSEEQSNDDFVRAHNAYSYMMSNAGPKMTAGESNISSATELKQNLPVCKSPTAEPVPLKVNTEPLLIEWHENTSVSSDGHTQSQPSCVKIPSFRDFLRSVPTSPRPQSCFSASTSLCSSSNCSLQLAPTRARPRPQPLHISTHATLVQYLATTTLLLDQYRDLLQALYEVLLIDLKLPFISPQVVLITHVMSDATKLVSMLAGLKEWLRTLHHFGKGYWIQHIGEVGRLEGQIVELRELLTGNVEWMEECLRKVQVEGCDVALVSEAEMLRDRVREYCGKEIDFSEDWGPGLSS